MERNLYLIVGGYKGLPLNLLELSKVTNNTMDKKVLLMNNDHPLAKAELSTMVLEETEDIYSNILKYHVDSLRRSVKDIKKKNKIIILECKLCSPGSNPARENVLRDMENYFETRKVNLIHDIQQIFLEPPKRKLGMRVIESIVNSNDLIEFLKKEKIIL